MDLARSRRERMVEVLRTADSATEALADWMDVETLNLERVVERMGHLLTVEERRLLKLELLPGVTHAYHRTGVLYTPKPGHRPVAWVEATVLTHLLPDDLRARVLAAREPLGVVLAELPGLIRTSERVTNNGGEDWAGELVAVQSQAVLSFGELPRPVAVVWENVYEAAVTVGLR